MVVREPPCKLVSEAGAPAHNSSSLLAQERSEGRPLKAAADVLAGSATSEEAKLKPTSLPASLDCDAEDGNGMDEAAVRTEAAAGREAAEDGDEEENNAEDDDEDEEDDDEEEESPSSEPDDTDAGAVPTSTSEGGGGVFSTRTCVALTVFRYTIRW